MPQYKEFKGDILKNKDFTSKLVAICPRLVFCCCKFPQQTSFYRLQLNNNCIDLFSLPNRRHRGHNDIPSGKMCKENAHGKTSSRNILDKRRFFEISGRNLLQ